MYPCASFRSHQEHHSVQTRIFYLWLLLCVTVAGCSSGRELPVVWEFSTNYATVTNPAVGAGYAVFGSDKLYCVEAQSGRLVWSFDTTGTVTSQPVIRNNKVYFQCGGLYCLDLASGKLLWEFWTEEWGDKTPVVSDAVVVCVREGTLYCIDESRGSKLYALPFAQAACTPVLAADALIIAAYGMLQCLDATRGTIRWQKAIPNADTRFSFAADERKLYMPVQQGIQAIDLTTGGPLWLFPIKDMLLINSFFIADDALYAAYGNLFCIDKENGSLLWQYTPPAPVFMPALDNGNLYAVNTRLKLCCIDLKQRTQIWEVKAKRSATFSDGFLYKGSGNAKAYCLKLMPQ